MKFCCKIIENSIDVKGINKKYKNIDGLLELINHLNFTCTCALNLHQDLEYLICKHKVDLEIDMYVSD